MTRQHTVRRSLSNAKRQTVRCPWAESIPLYRVYHDEEWGVPLHDDLKLFEMLVLEGAQAGLSWLTILKKREGYRKAFDGFDSCKIARYGSGEIKRLLVDEGIVRNRLKIVAVISNARAFHSIQKEFGTFDSYLWQFVNGSPIQNHWKRLAEIPTRTAQSETLSKDLKLRGFSFVGSKICYAFMQSIGMVNDHTRDCFRHSELGGT